MMMVVALVEEGAQAQCQVGDLIGIEIVGGRDGAEALLQE